MKKKFLSKLLVGSLAISSVSSMALAEGVDNPFKDVKTTDWYFDSVQYVYQKNLLKGVTEDSFAPSEGLTRAMLGMILYRMEGEPTVQAKSFSDVEDDKWYALGILWANEKNIIVGYENGNIGPQDYVTREQLALILYRYAQLKNYDTSTTAVINTFSDENIISDDAKQALNWAVEKQIFIGRQNDVLAPKGMITRAELATTLMRFCETFKTYEAVQRYTVKFDLNYENMTTYQTQEIDEGHVVFKPENPSRSGYTFAGWYTSENGNNEYDFKKALNKDLTLYAKWDKNISSSKSSSSSSKTHKTYNLTIEAGEGGKVTTGTTGNYQEGSEISIVAIPDEGYIFDGWVVSNGGTIKDVNSAQTTFIMPDKATAVTARFKAVATTDIKLLASEKSILVSNEAKCVYFYAESNEDIESISLFDENKNLLAEMKDDGLYSISGDDIQNDGVFSCKLDIDASQVKKLTYQAIDDKGRASDMLTINVYADLVSEEIQQMQVVDDQIAAAKESSEYKSASLQERIEMIGKLLKSLAEQGLIIPETIYYDDGMTMYTFTYYNNVLGGTMLKEFDEETNSIDVTSEEILKNESKVKEETAVEEQAGDQSEVKEDAAVKDEIEDEDEVKEEVKQEVEDQSEVKEEVKQEAEDQKEVKEDSPEVQGEEIKEAEEIVAENKYQALIDKIAASDQSVQDMLTTLQSSETYEQSIYEEQVDMVKNLLNELIQTGKILEGSVEYLPERSLFTFNYLDGIKDRIQVAPSAQVNQLLMMSSLNSLESEKVDLGDAIILNAFENTSFRRDYYPKVQAEWNDKGLETTVDVDVTVNDLKNLEDYELVVFSGHGGYVTYKYGNQGENSITEPIWCLNEKATTETDKAYSADLKQHNIIKVDGTYYVFPSLLSEAYDTDDLDGSFIFSESCQFMGKDNNVVDSMAEALTDSSAETVVGYHNSVDAVYSREFMKTYIDNLIEGVTVQDAFDKAISENGANDGKGAYPILTGDANATLYNMGLRNGSFEDSAFTPTDWEKVGDVRVLSKLGELVPQHGKRMAILTTGLGSAEEGYVAQKEGSMMMQKVMVPADANTISFNYNVVSEEPMEFVGSGFDDTFMVEILDSEGNAVGNTVCESVNSAAWSPIDGINFEGGDNTVYQTTWKKGSIDVSSYRNKMITLRFKVYDVGDSIYDTAAVIDNVEFK